MIPILKNQNEENIGFLVDALTCNVTEERNGEYEVELTYPISGSFADDLVVDNIILAKPNDTSDNQLFRIYEVTKPISGIITVLGEHISYALSNYPITKISLSRTLAQAAIQALISTPETSRFSCFSDVTYRGKFEVEACSVRAALGGVAGSILDVYGGEYEFDNYTIKLHKYRGNDNGVSIRYGKNLTDCTMVTNLESTYTHLFPYAYGKDADGNKKLVTTSERIFPMDVGRYSTRVLIKDFTDMFAEDETINEENLLSYVYGFILDYEGAEPSINLTVSFQHLWQSPEYADLQALEKVSLCDIVHVYHEQLGVNVTAKVIKTIYDSLGEKYKSIEIGNAKSNFADTIRQQEREIQEIKQEPTEYSKITQEYTRAIEEASKTITGNKGGYVVIEPITAPQEILIMNTQNKSTASRLWRWNLSGLGYSNTGYNGTYRTAITMDGRINADFITTGTLTANIIRAGVLASADWSSYFDLESGYLSTSQANITGGYISIGSGTYRTVIDDGHIKLYLNSSATEIGGIVPVGVGSNYYTGIYASKASNVKGVSLLSENSDGSFSTIAQFGKTAIDLNKGVNVTGNITASGNITFDSYLFDGRGYQVVGMNNNLVFGYGNYSLGFPTYIEGGDIYLRCKSGYVRYQVGSTTRTTIGLMGWKLGSDTTYVNRDTIETSGGFVLSANSGSNAMYVVASTFRILTDAYLNFSAASGTVALAVNTKGKITVTSSSARYKENITYNLQRNLNPRKLYGLPVCQYNYQNKYQSIELVHGTQIGLLAEDVDAYFPNACIYNADGQPESWHERILLPAMLKLIQEQKQEIDSLNERLNNLEKEQNYGTDYQSET